MRRKLVIPENHTAIEFLREQMSKIIEKVAEKDEILLVNKNSKPQDVIISYNRYCR